MGEEMGVRGSGVEKLLLRMELLCVSLLVCSRGREKSKEVLGVAFLLLVFLGIDIVGMVERAGVDGLARARGRERAARRSGPARHRSGERLGGYQERARAGTTSGAGRARWMAGREKELGLGGGRAGSALDQPDRSGTSRPVPVYFRPFFCCFFFRIKYLLALQPKTVPVRFSSPSTCASPYHGAWPVLRVDQPSHNTANCPSTHTACTGFPIQGTIQITVGRNLAV